MNKLVFSGGGIKGIAFIGCLKALKERDILKNIDTFVGSSVGSVISLLVILGYTPEEIETLVLDLDFKSLQDIKPLKLLTSFGIDSGKNMKEKICKLIEDKLSLNASEGSASVNSRDITLLELYEKTKKTFVVVTTCLNTHKTEYMDYTTEPDLKVCDAIRMSTSIPFLFTSVTYKNKIYTDGSLLDNYPIGIFEKGDKSYLGFTLFQTDSDSSVKEINSIYSFISNVIYCVFKELESNKDQTRNQTVFIKSNINPINFSIKNEKKRELIDSGYTETIKYLG